MTGSRVVRRRGLFAFGTVATVLMLSSAAFACTTFKGQFSLSQGGVTKTNVGSNSGMSFCPNTTVNTMSLTQTGGFTVSVAPRTTNPCRASLSTNTYAIKHSDSTLVSDCMNGTPFIESLSVTSGSGSQAVAGGQLLLTDDTVCITDANFNQGNGMKVVVT